MKKDVRLSIDILTMFMRIMSFNNHDPMMKLLLKKSSGMTRRGFIGCAAGALVGCSSVHDFRSTEAGFAETDLGVMIAKEIDNELDIHSYGEGTQEEALAAKAGVERWLAHMKDNGYVEDYNVLVRPCAENSGGRLFFSSVMVKARGYRAAVFDRVVTRNVL